MEENPYSSILMSVKSLKKGDVLPINALGFGVRSSVSTKGCDIQVSTDCWPFSVHTYLAFSAIAKIKSFIKCKHCSVQQFKFKECFRMSSSWHHSIRFICPEAWNSTEWWCQKLLTDPERILRNEDTRVLKKKSHFSIDVLNQSCLSGLYWGKMVNSSHWWSPQLIKGGQFETCLNQSVLLDIKKESSASQMSFQEREQILHVRRRSPGSPSACSIYSGGWVWTMGGSE